MHFVKKTTGARAGTAVAAAGALASRCRAHAGPTGRSLTSALLQPPLLLLAMTRQCAAAVPVGRSRPRRTPATPSTPPPGAPSSPSGRRTVGFTRKLAAASSPIRADRSPRVVISSRLCKRRRPRRHSGEVALAGTPVTMARSSTQRRPLHSLDPACTAWSSTS